MASPCNYTAAITASKIGLSIGGRSRSPAKANFTFSAPRQSVYSSGSSYSEKFLPMQVVNYRVKHEFDANST